MKLFGAKRNCGYCGGLIVVAANNIKEAYHIYIKWAKNNGKSWIYDDCESDGEVVSYIDRYPPETWYELEGIEVNCKEPRVIDEDGYTE